MNYFKIKILSVLLISATIAIAVGTNYAFALTVQPKVAAFYLDSLATKMTTGDTSMTLVRGTDTQSRSISGLYGFVIDEGTASQETVIGTASGINVSALVRGADVAYATTSVSANIFAHSRGASVKITTWPSVGVLNNELSGVEGIPQPIQYDPSVATTTVAANRKNLASVGLVQDVAFSGAGITFASANAYGTVQFASAAQAAASTLTGSTGAQLSLGASIATSTWNSATAANVIPVTKGTGKIDDNFISTSTLFTNAVFTSTTTKIGAFSAWQIGKQVQVVTAVGTSTFSVPSGITKIWVRLVGAGGSGGESASGACGGAAGGYADKMLDVTGTTTIQMFVGTGGVGVNATNVGLSGTWTTFGTNGFYLSATPGGGGQTGDNCMATPGLGSGGDINAYGSPSTAPLWHSTTAMDGIGGASMFSGGGLRGLTAKYGAGGNSRSDAAQSGSGADGLILIYW